MVRYVVARTVAIGDKKTNPLLGGLYRLETKRGLLQKIVQQIPGGNIRNYFFVESNSNDNTLEEIKRGEVEEIREERLKYFVQLGKGKGDAVRLGFEMAEGDILAIYDADMTVPAKDLEKFYIAIADGKGNLSMVPGWFILWKMSL